MNKTNTQKLLKRFPLLYRGYYKSAQESCFSFGFECHDGWFDVLWQLSLAIEDELDYGWFTRTFYKHIDMFVTNWNKVVQTLPEELEKKFSIHNNVFEVSQVKQKFASLRYYTSATPKDKSKKIHRYINYAELITTKICEYCGEFGEMNKKRHWMEVLCKDCTKKKDDNEKAELEYYEFKRIFRKRYKKSS